MTPLGQLLAGVLFGALAGLSRGLGFAEPGVLLCVLGMEVGKKYFEQLIDEMKEARKVKLDTELTADDLKELAEKFKAEYKDKLGEDFPQDPKVQLMGAIKAVFRSWDNPRAIYYRRMVVSSNAIICGIWCPPGWTRRGRAARAPSRGTGGAERSCPDLSRVIASIS